MTHKFILGLAALVLTAFFFMLFVFFPGIFTPVTLFVATVLVAGLTTLSVILSPTDKFFGTKDSQVHTQ